MEIYQHFSFEELNGQADKHSLTVVVAYNGTPTDANSLKVALQAFAGLYTATLERIVHRSVIGSQKTNNTTPLQPIAFRQFTHKGEKGSVTALISSNSRLNLNQLKGEINAQFVDQLVESLERQNDTR